MKVFDNVTNIVRDDMEKTIKRHSRVSVAAACFSMYAYSELKKQLENIDEFRFIFTSPTFVKEKEQKQRRAFYIPRLDREQSLYGTEFEIKLRNEMTQKAIAKECADWIRRKATFQSNTTGENMGGFMTVESGAEETAYMPLSGFTTVDIGCERGNGSYNMVNRLEAPFATRYLQLFDTIWNDREKLQDVTDVVLENITTAYIEIRRAGRPAGGTEEGNRKTAGKDPRGEAVEPADGNECGAEKAKGRTGGTFKWRR